MCLVAVQLLSESSYLVVEAFSGVDVYISINLLLACIWDVDKEWEYKKHPVVGGNYCYKTTQSLQQPHINYSSGPDGTK